MLAFLGLLLFVGAALGVVAAHGARPPAPSPQPTSPRWPRPRPLARGEDPCAAGGIGRRRQRGRLRVLRRRPERDVRVTVEVAGPRWLGQAADLTAEARAGPG